MKKIFLILISLLLLTACGSSDDKVSGIETVEFSGSGFTIQLPKNWTSSGSMADAPAQTNGTIVATSVSPEKKYNFSDNIMIIEDSLNYIGTSTQYSEQNHNKTREKYFEYQHIKKNDIIFSDSDPSKYFVFNAKYNDNTQKLRFVQTAKICGTRVYLLHSTLAL